VLLDLRIVERLEITREKEIIDLRWWRKRFFLEHLEKVVKRKSGNFK